MKKEILRRRTWLIAGLVLLLGVIGVSLLGVGTLRSGYDQAASRTKAAKELSRTIAADSTNRTARVDAIESASRLKSDDLCKKEWWNAWLAGIGELKTHTRQCEITASRLTAFSTAARAAGLHIRDEAKISMQLSRLRPDTKVKDWPVATLGAAQSVKGELDGIGVIVSAEPVLVAAKQRTAAILTGWNALIQASAKKDKTAYMAAETQLKQSYADIGAIADVADTQLLTALRPLHAHLIK